MQDRTSLMQIGKLELVREDWCWGSVLQFEHEEVQQDSFYRNEKVETEITVGQANKLIEHLTNFIAMKEAEKLPNS